jgi:hypothetical protein
VPQNEHTMVVLSLQQNLGPHLGTLTIDSLSAPISMGVEKLEDNSAT